MNEISQNNDDETFGAICGGGPYRYQVCVHRVGARKWEPVGKPRHTVASAFAVLATERERNRDLNRGGIWAVEKFPSYYEPHQVYEVTVR